MHTYAPNGDSAHCNHTKDNDKRLRDTFVVVSLRSQLAERRFTGFTAVIIGICRFTPDTLFNTIAFIFS